MHRKCSMAFTVDPVCMVKVENELLGGYGGEHKDDDKNNFWWW